MIKTIKGEGSHIKMGSPDISIFEINLQEGIHHFSMKKHDLAWFILISGYPNLGEHLFEKDDFALVSNTDNLILEAETP